MPERFIDQFHIITKYSGKFDTPRAESLLSLFEETEKEAVFSVQSICTARKDSASRVQI